MKILIGYPVRLRRGRSFMKKSSFNNRQPVDGLSRLLVYGLGFCVFTAGAFSAPFQDTSGGQGQGINYHLWAAFGSIVPVRPAHAQESVSQKPGIEFHKSLPRKIREEIRIIDDFTVEVGLGSDRKSVSGSIEDAVQSIPLVGRGNKPKKAFVGDTRIYKQKNGLYTWDKRGRKDVRLSAEDVKKQGIIRVSLERKSRPVEPVKEPARKAKIEPEEKTVERAEEPIREPGETKSQTTVITQEPAGIKGFRSARFGMAENEIYNAIATDFQVRGDQVEPITDMVNKTSGLAVTVPNLLANSGLARVAYVFGYRTKKLIQVNILWGFPITPNADAQALVSTANTLRNHFLKKGLARESIITNQLLNDGSIVVFRGADERGRMILLLMNVVQNPQNNEESPKQNPKSFLRLSYVENPATPDVFQIKPGEF